MEDMERGLQEMAQSVEHMQEMLKRSPTVQALAQRQPEVRAASALRQDQENVSLLPRWPAGNAACSRLHLTAISCEHVGLNNAEVLHSMASPAAHEAWSASDQHQRR